MAFLCVRKIGGRSVTGYYAFVTKRILETNNKAVLAMREQTEAIYRPYIAISHFLDENALIRLVIKNTGHTNAQQLRLKIDRDFYQQGLAEEAYNLKSLFLFNNEIQNMPPNTEFLLSLIPTAAIAKNSEQVNSMTPVVFNITATYSFGGKSVTETTSIDLRVYEYTFLSVGSVEVQLAKLNKRLDEFLKNVQLKS